jgi:hypothetical protein
MGLVEAGGMINMENKSSNIRICTKCSSVLWPSITEDFTYLCPLCDVVYRDDDGELNEVKGGWLGDVKKW